MTASCLYLGAVTHTRVRPKRHHLRYSLFNVLIDLEDLPSLHGGLRFFSADRFNLMSFHQTDFGAGDAGGLLSWVRAQLHGAGIDASGAVRVLCMPRMLGHAFNPISVFFCHRADGSLAAMLYQVNNTFGERHCYLIPVEGGGTATQIAQACDKRFYVSPFMPMEMQYRFRVSLPGRKVALAIQGLDAGGPLIATSFGGVRQALTDRNVLGLVLRVPWLGAKVLAAIHWEALRLWLRGVRLVRRPPPPANPVSITLKESRV